MFQSVNHALHTTDLLVSLTQTAVLVWRIIRMYSGDRSYWQNSYYTTATGPKDTELILKSWVYWNVTDQSPNQESDQVAKLTTGHGSVKSTTMSWNHNWTATCSWSDAIHSDRSVQGLTWVDSLCLWSKTNERKHHSSQFHFDFDSYANPEIPSIHNTMRCRKFFFKQPPDRSFGMSTAVGVTTTSILPAIHVAEFSTGRYGHFF